MINLDNVLTDIETMLIGLELQPINSSTGVLYVTKIDRDAGKYFVFSPKDRKTTGRTISTEIGAIINDLNRKGFCNVDQSLFGSGSSRNHPETIFANLPYIQYFKYKNKKHILLRNKNVHDAGTLSEVQGQDFRLLRKQVDKFLNLNLDELNARQNRILQDMYDAYDVVLKKYPGELSAIKVESSLGLLKEINDSLSEAIVSLDDKNDFNSDIELNINHYNSFEDALDNPDNTGIDSGDDIEDDADEKELESDSVKKSGVIKVIPFTPTLSLIFDRVQFGDIELQPDFQRKDRIWKQDKKAKLIESILMRLPIPVFYFGQKGDTWIVVDGLQRITSIYDFISGYFPLTDLEVLPNLNGKYFKDLSRTEQRDIREYAITAYLIDVNDENSNMIVELFHRINTYGVKLSDQEIRSALNQGSSVKFLRYLASLDSFKNATRNKVKPDRQKDMELCLSALSFMVQGYENYSQNSYDSFLSQTMRLLNKYNLILDNEENIDSGKASINAKSKQYLELYYKYNASLILAKEIFGDFAFVKEPANKNAPISKQLFEIVIYYFSILSAEQKITLKNNQSEFLDLLYTAIENNSPEYAEWTSQAYRNSNRGFRDSISTSTGKRITVLYRFSAFSAILEKSTGISFSKYTGDE